MSWLTSDVNLLETDAEQLRLHLGWLLEDLLAQRAQLNGQAEVVEELAAELGDCLERLAHLDALLGRVRRAVG